MFKEFKEFAVRGNVLDMAVGIIIGGAFGKIVSSFVSDIIMPPIGIMLGGVDFSDLAITFREATNGVPAITLSYGIFINTVIDFIIIAFAVFVLIKQINKFKRRELPPTPTQKECPHCLSKISLKATKCAFCTADISVL
jgi:large conductance mechanosensitive channel